MRCYLTADVTGSRQPENAGTELLGSGSYLPTGAHDFAMARDAMVVIVNNASTIKHGSINLTADADGVYYRALTLNELRTIFNSDGSTASHVIGKRSHDWQVYLLPPADGTRRFLDAGATPSGYRLTIPDGFSGHGSAQNYHGTYCHDDWGILDKVTADPLGIGIVSAAVADQHRVTIAMIKDIPGGKAAWRQLPNCSYSGTDICPTSHWPFTRTLYVRCSGAARRADGRGIGNVMFDPNGNGYRALLAGPMFKASYFTP